MNLESLLFKQRQLMEHVPHEISVNNIHRLIAAKGLVEEVLEYLNSVGTKPWRPNPLPREDQLEELTDSLHFFLELIILSGFSLEEIEDCYHTKWQTNMDRYTRGKQGDYSWDDRISKTEL